MQGALVIHFDSIKKVNVTKLATTAPTTYEMLLESTSRLMSNFSREMEDNYFAKFGIKVKISFSLLDEQGNIQYTGDKDNIRFNIKQVK